MAEPRSSEEPPEPEDEKRPSGLPAASSSRRRSLRPPARRGLPEGAEAASEPTEAGAPEPEPADAEPEPARSSVRPPGLRNLTTSARRRLQLAFEDDDDEDPEDDEDEAKRPRGLLAMTHSARQRLQLALEHDEDSIRPPAMPAPPAKPRRASTHVPLDEVGHKLVRSLMRWVAFSGLLTLTVGALTGLSYLTGPGSVAHVVVGILASALSVWLLAAALSFRRVLSRERTAHHLVNGFGLLRSALLLKAVLLFSAMVLGCFTFSIATGLLLLL